MSQVVLTVGSCQVELTKLGFLVTQDGEPVPARVFAPAVQGAALLLFESKSHAGAYAKAIDTDDMPEAHRLIAEHGRWWA
jgi:hypothetical protein